MRIPRLALTALAALAFAPSAHAAVPPVTFTNYAGPTDLVADAGEPSIGYNPKTGAVLFQSHITYGKVGGRDVAGHAHWRDVTEPTAITSLDPSLWMVTDTGRRITSQ